MTHAERLRALATLWESPDGDPEIHHPSEAQREEAAAMRAGAEALDRQERGQGTKSAVQEVSEQFGLRCVSILTLADLIETISRAPGDASPISQEKLAALRAYQRDWGVAAVPPGAKPGAE